jgi:hypothetical protein
VKHFAFELPIYIKDSHEIYRWDLVNVKIFPSIGTMELFMMTWNTLFSEKCLHVGPNLVYDAADMAKMLICGTLENFMTTWNTLLSKKMLTCGTPPKFHDD